MGKNSTPLGCIPVDAVQSFRKVYCVDNEAHRVAPINTDYNIIEYEYTSDGKVSTISYYYEADAECTKITFVDDCAANLCGKSFKLNTPECYTNFKIHYSVDCGSQFPASDGEKVIGVNITSCDPAAVVALATKQAMCSNSVFTGLFTLSLKDDILNALNINKGHVINPTGNSGFSFCVITEGTKVLKEKLTFTYDSSGNLTKVENTSGENLINYYDVGSQSVAISGGGNVAEVSDNNELRTELSPAQESVFYELLAEIKILNLHMSVVSGEEFNKEDVEDI